MFKWKGARRWLESGQGLVDYALVIMLVGIVVVVVMMLFGGTVENLYCQAVYAVNPSAEIEACESIEVSCPYTVGSHWINLEAVVTDTKGEDNVEKVIFTDNGSFAEDEFFVPFCMGSNPSSADYCNRYTYTSGGTHEIVAIATDAEGNTGQCKVTVTVP